MIVDYRRPARQIVTVQLDEAGGRRPAIPPPMPPRAPLTPSPTVPCRFVGLRVGLLALHRMPAVHGGRPSTSTQDPLGRRLGWGSVKARQTKQAVIKAVCCLHLESNRDDASPLTASALTAWDAPGSQAVQARKVPVSKMPGTVRMVWCFSR